MKHTYDSLKLKIKNCIKKQWKSNQIESTSKTEKQTVIDESNTFPPEMKLAELSVEQYRDNIDFTNHMRTRMREIPKSAIWFLPAFTNPLAGGIRTILMTAQHLSTQWGTHNTIVRLRSNRYDPGVEAARLSKLFPNLQFTILTYDRLAASSSFPEADIAFCTFWTTAYVLAKYSKCKSKYYFMQDYESLFYPAGTCSALVEQTYRFGFHCIANSKGIADCYSKFSDDYMYFTPGVDNNTFYPSTDEGKQDNYQIVFYGRPNNQRNAFALGVEALKKVKTYWGDQVNIISAGADWNPKEFGLDGIINNVGVLKSLDDVASLYRSSDMGLVFMLTPHPSYQPLEYMASGCITVTNQNPYTGWLLKHGRNAVITPLVPGLIAECIINTLENLDVRRTIRNGGLETARSLNWNMAFKHICDYILFDEML